MNTGGNGIGIQAVPSLFSSFRISLFYKEYNPMNFIPKPEPGEYTPYTLMYIRLVPDDGQVLKHLRDNLEATKAFIRSFPEEKLSTPHEPGEWTIKEILVHISDTERIFAYRALRFARLDATELAGFEQNDYVPVSEANKRNIESILDEYTAVRLATSTLFESFDEEVYTRTGIASENRVSIRALAYIIAFGRIICRNSGFYGLGGFALIFINIFRTRPGYLSRPGLPVLLHTARLCRCGRHDRHQDRC
jgi:hypothetical protein